MPWLRTLMPITQHAISRETIPGGSHCALTGRLLNIAPIKGSTMSTQFEPGKTYFGTLSCAHGDFPVVCVKRTDQSVWFTKRGYRDMRCKIKTWSGVETATFHGWYVSADKQTGGDFDPMTI
jgi:hypothetical protein